MTEKHKYKPVGELAQLCETYQAPEDVQTKLARRVGAIVGNTDLPVPKVENVIQKSMATNGGLPDWKKVEDTIGTEVREIYRRHKKGI